MEEQTKQLSSKEIADICVAIADDRKAENILQLKVTDLSFIADYFVIATANSQPHMKAVSETIGRDLRNKHNVRPLHVEGKPQSGWILMDYGMVVVHVLTEEARELYDLENLWGDAPKREAIEILKELGIIKQD
jgi:ribosome-associated protein